MYKQLLFTVLILEIQRTGEAIGVKGGSILPTFKSCVGWNIFQKYLNLKY